MKGGILWTVIVLLSLHSALAFYLPGLSPKNYEKGETIDLKYNKISSGRTQLPFEYSKLPVCKLEKEIHSVQNLGEVLRGDRISKSPFDIKMHEDVACKPLCPKFDVDEKTSKRLAELIKNQYEVEWIIENLPGATISPGPKGEKFYHPGFPFGSTGENKKAYLNNHFDIVIRYHNDPKEYSGSRIVAFEVSPKSISSANRDGCPKSLSETSSPQEVGTATSLLYTYSLTFKEEKDIKWVDRWNLYLVGGDIHIHWYSIINSIVIAMALSAVIAFVMLRTLRRDIVKYNDAEEAEQDITGWKLVYGDVFRPPKNSVLLSALVGSGLQLFGMALTTTLFALIGVLNPSYRGGMTSFAAFVFVSMGSFGGYHAARLNKNLKGGSWQRVSLLTGSLAPATLFTIFFLLNLFIWSQNSSSAIPVGTFVAIVVLWFCVSLPLVFFGAYFGQKKQPIEYPVRINHIPRQIPDLPWYLLPQFCIPVAGLIPFCVIFIELSFIMTSIWQDQYYYLYGFLAIIFLLLIVTCIEISIVVTYFHLSWEDYRWWWRSFLIPSSSTVYIFIYSTFYYVNGLEIVYFVPGLIYFTYVFMASVVYFLCTGTIGFLSCFYFLRKIYSAVKID